jgi:hypothetical protein
MKKINEKQPRGAGAFFDLWEQIDEGLERALEDAQPGIPMSLEEISEYCGISRQAVHQMEQRALKKIRPKLKPLYKEIRHK